LNQRQIVKAALLIASGRTVNETAEELRVDASRIRKLVTKSMVLKQKERLELGYVKVKEYVPVPVWMMSDENLQRHRESVCGKGFKVKVKRCG
jgi:predicted transcriptional regulator